ncbi:unnamed protein product [Ranitomeya imitator]|uniref:Reverse transcriptase domain-containing protein n=1 Tax=Ranitomeya imitator TaxID=111125 RepID=A0ABN9M6K9_9NEOB|nr:unnamed protein product [Ranitomeya imitator]
MVVDDEEKANILNTFFSTVFTVENEMLGEIPRNNENPILRVTNLTQQEVRNRLNKIKIDKSPGPDGIHPRVLRELKLSLLQKGLSFCPTPSWDDFQLERELQRFFRTVRLKTHFGTKDDTNNNATVSQGTTSVPVVSISSLGLRNPSNYKPPRSYHATETFIELVDREVKQLSHQQKLGLFPTHPNLAPSEKRALKSLTENKGIIIKPADKGGATVVMDRHTYCQEVHRQLSDTETYQAIPRDPTFDIDRKIKHIVKSYLDRNIIDHKTATFLSHPHPITPVFYILPKIHKSLINPPGRPIVASTESILSPLSVFLEKILTPLVRKTKSFLLDTGHFLTILKQLGSVSPDSLLVTFDVNSLYTSISHDKGIEATKSLLEESNHTPDTVQLCLDLLSLVLYENYFLYEDTFYNQQRGTAMGSNMAPAYANAFMNHFEVRHVFTNPLFQQNAICYHRFIDDIFLIWKGTTTTLDKFFTFLNSIYHELKFTIHHDNSVSFLDTLVVKDSMGNLQTDLFCKPTDCNSILHYTSCHPKSTKNSIPRSQFHRVTRIVSETTTATTRLETMAQKFQERSYPSNLIAKEKIRALTPSSPPPRMQQNERVPFVHTYHPLMPKVHSIIRKHWPLLARAYPNIESFNNPTLMCTKRAANLRDKLVRADIGSAQPTVTQRLLGTRRNGTFPCLSCASCSNVIKSENIVHPRTGKSYPIKGYYTCNSNFVVYLVKCPCGLLYVGETTQHIKDRISSHKSTIRCSKTWLPLPDHFLKNHHSIAQLKFQVIEQIDRPRRGGDRVRTLKQRESYWIHTLDTLEPRGLNREINWLI